MTFKKHVKTILFGKHYGTILEQSAQWCHYTMHSLYFIFCFIA